MDVIHHRMKMLAALRWEGKSKQRHSGELGEYVDELVLEAGIHRFCGRPLLFAVIPVSAADSGRGIVADREPCLGEVTHFEVVGCSGSAHLCGNPAWIDRVADDIGPVSRDREREGSHEQLTVAVGLGLVPGTLRPVDVVEGRFAAAMHATAEVDEPIRPTDERGEHVRSQRVDGERLCMAFGRGAAGWNAVHARVVDYGVHGADFVHLFGNSARFVGAAQISDYYARRLINEISDRRSAIFRSGMEHDFVSVRYKIAGCREAQSIGAAGDENSTHDTMILRECSQNHSGYAFASATL